MESQREQYVRTGAEVERPLLAEGAATEWARAERAEALVVDMLDALRGILGALYFPTDVELARARANEAIAKATGANP